jgi:hypothetical protein
MDPNSSAVVAEVIAKLQGLLGQGGSAPSGPKEALIPPFDTAFALCQQKAKTLSPEIQKLVALHLRRQGYTNPQPRQWSWFWGTVPQAKSFPRPNSKN